MRRNIDLNLLTVFLAVYDARNVSAAAAELEMTQPGLSTALRRLRQQLDDPLFIPTASGMSPTSRARELEEPVRSILALIDRQVLTSSAFDPATADNEFRIAMSDVGELSFLPPLMSALASQAPRVKVRAVTAPFNEIARKMEAGELDLALGYFPDLKSNNIVGTVFARITFGCFVRPQHAFANRQITLQEFLESRHILVEPVGRSQEVLETFLKSKGIKRNVVLTTAHFLCVPQILASTDLIATMPITLSGAQPNWGGAPVQLPFELPTVDLKMYWHRTMHANVSHQWLRRLISKFVKG